MRQLLSLLASNGRAIVQARGLATRSAPKNEQPQPIQRLHGKVAAITASTDGIGLCIARRLAQEGASVVVSSRNIENVKRASQILKEEGLSAEGVVCHAEKPEQRKDLYDCAVGNFGGLDIVISNAAASPGGSTKSMLDSTPDEWDKILSCNIKSSYFLAAEAIPHMERRGAGSLIFISTILSCAIPPEFATNALKHLGPYAVSKGGLNALSRILSSFSMRKNIRSNVVMPGLVKTGFSKAIWSQGDQDYFRQMINEFDIPRMGTSEDMAGAVAFLASDDSAFITGETIMVTGGARFHV